MIDDVFSFDDFLNKNGSKKLEPVTSIKDKFEEELNYKEEQEVVSEKKELVKNKYLKSKEYNNLSIFLFILTIICF